MNPINLLTRYEAGEPWFILASEEGTLLDGFAVMCFQKMEDFWFPNKDSIVYDDLYCHVVVAHAFMEFVWLSGVLSSGEKFVFDKFCKVNKVPEDIIDEAWETYKND